MKRTDHSLWKLWFQIFKMNMFKNINQSEKLKKNKPKYVKIMKISSICIVNLLAHRIGIKTGLYDCVVNVSYGEKLHQSFSDTNPIKMLARYVPVCISMFP